MWVFCFYDYCYWVEWVFFVEVYDICISGLFVYFDDNFFVEVVFFKEVFCSIKYCLFFEEFIEFVEGFFVFSFCGEDYIVFFVKGFEF